MSWSRFGSGSPVYTYEHVDGHLVCGTCSLMPDYRCFTTGDVDTFLLHLSHHPDVPAELVDRIRRDMEVPGR